MTNGRVRRLAHAGVALLAMAAVVWLSAAAVGQTPIVGVAELKRSLDGLLSQPALSQAWVGVRVETLDGEVLYDYNGSKLMMPASNMKLITAAAGLELLGPDFTWETKVWFDAWDDAVRSAPLPADEPLPASLEGNVYLQGGGDPTLLEEDLLQIARRLYARGVRRIAGNVVFDDSFFDGVLRGPGWEWDYLDAYYAAPVSGLSLAPDTDYDANTVKVSVYPGPALFGPALVTVAPRLSGIEVVNRATTAGSAATGNITVTWEDGRTLIVSGYTPQGKGPTNVWIAVREPAPWVARVFLGALREAGIEVSGDVVPGRVPPGAVLVDGHSSLTLAELLIPFMKLSNNGHGEVILKTLGRRFRSQGTWEAGRAVIESFLRDVVRVPGTFNVSDGSGLSRKNLVAPEQITAVLRYMAKRPNFQYFYGALPVAGAPDRLVGGTLRSRLAGTPAAYNVRAKTGTLSNVSALSGYVTTLSGEQIVFSIILNHAVGVSAATYQDTLANVLVRYRSE